ncbi:MAG: hypothetical protein GY756_20775 [bacterium]|nr:hypothetical protein [bacterium]
MKVKSYKIRNVIYLSFVVALITITSCEKSDLDGEPMNLKQSSDVELLTKDYADLDEEPTDSIQYRDIELLTMDYADLKKAKSNSLFSTNEAFTISSLFTEWDDEENKYKFNMSHEQAVELHIKDSDFEEIIRMLKRNNDTIKEWLSIPNKKWSVTTPKEAIKVILERNSEFNWWEPQPPPPVSQEQPGSTRHETEIKVWEWDTWFYDYNNIFDVDMDPRYVHIKASTSDYSALVNVALMQRDPYGEVHTTTQSGFSYNTVYTTELKPFFIGTGEPATLAMILLQCERCEGRGFFSWYTDF